MVVTGGAEPKTYELGNKYLFQLISSADHYLSGAVDALHAKNPQAQVAFVYSDDPFSKAVVIAARAQATEAGLKVVLDESYPPSTTDFSPIINKIISAQADALLGGGHYPDGATLAVGHKQFRTYDAETGAIRQHFDYPQFLAQLRFSPDGRHFAFPAERNRQQFVVLEGREIGPFEHVLGLAFSATLNAPIPRQPRFGLFRM